MDRIWIIDTEGNGAQPCEIIEVAMVEMVDLRLTGRACRQRFRPKNPVTWHAKQVHGISNKDLEGCRPIEDYLGSIRKLITDEPIAGHAVHVELGLLSSCMEDWSPRLAYDTLRMVRRAYPDLERHKLHIIGEHMGLTAKAGQITRGKPHSAYYDAVLAGLVIETLTAPLGVEERLDLLAHAEVMEQRRRNAQKAAQKAQKAQMRRRVRA